MKNLTLVFVLTAASVISGCSLQNMIKAAQDSNLQVNPNPLEVHGGKVPHKITAELPPKTLPKGKVFTIFTVYQYNNNADSVAVGEIEVNADDYPNAKDQVTPVDKDFTFDYGDGMNPGTLQLYGKATNPKNGKSQTSDVLSVVQGLILTSLMIEDVAYPAYADHDYTPRDEYTPVNIDFYFEQGRSVVKSSLNTDGMSNSKKREQMSAFIAEKNVTKTVTITGTHSPEGTETVNSALAPERAQAIEDIYRRNMSRYDYKGQADSIEFIQKPIIQDWSGFKAALSNYDGVSADVKSQMMQIVNGAGTFEEKEDALQDVEGYKKVFDDVYPGLRSAKTEILKLIEKKSPAEIAVLAKQVVNGEAPADTLSTEEMMFAAAQTPSLEEKESIYKAVIDKDGNWAAHNNLGATYIEMAMRGDASKLDAALTQLEIAKNKESGAAEISLNMASIYVMQGDDDQAYDAASAVGGSNALNSKANSIKGTIEAKRGDYESAEASLNAAEGDAKTSTNKGLVYLLTKDYEQAGTALEDAGNNAEDDSDLAKINYLLAVNAARQENAEQVTQYLKASVGKDASYKEKALNDLEFRNVVDARDAAVN